MANTDTAKLRAHLAAGQVIPAMPLALEKDRSWSQRHQRALVRYYLEAGAGGLAVGVHSTQFEIREPNHSLFEPVLELCSREIDAALEPGRSFVKVAGLCGDTAQAVAEASFARNVSYDAGLLSLSAMGEADDETLITHCREVAAVLPIVGFYLQPAIGGRSYGYSFWREFVEIENVVAIKVAPFDRYATLDVARALAESGRTDVSLYTGNDDNIIHDLLTEFPFEPTRVGHRPVGHRPVGFVGGLLGQWAVGTRQAVSLLREIREGSGDTAGWARRNASLTDFNSAIFDSSNGFAGCLSGMNEMLKRDGLVPSHYCLEESESLSPGQAGELDRVSAAYPEWQDTEFIRANLDRWLSD